MLARSPPLHSVHSRSALLHWVQHTLFSSLVSLQSRSVLLQLNAHTPPSILPLHSLHFALSALKLDSRSALLHTRCSTRSPHLLSLHSLQSGSVLLQLNAHTLPSILPLLSLHSVHSRSVAVECTHAPLLSLHSVHSRSAAIECSHAPLLSSHSVMRVQFLRSNTMSVGCSQCITCLGFNLYKQWSTRHRRAVLLACFHGLHALHDHVLLRDLHALHVHALLHVLHAVHDHSSQATSSPPLEVSVACLLLRSSHYLTGIALQCSLAVHLLVGPTSALHVRPLGLRVAEVLVIRRG